MTRRHLLAGTIALFALMFSAPAAAEVPLTAITFDELAAQPIHGLSFKGVTFAFAVGSVPSSDASYHGAGPGTTTWVDDPSLEGSAFGTLTLAFHQPTTVLEFGIARGCICALAPGVSVELFRAGAADRLHTTITEPTTPVITFSEALFRYRGPAVQRAVISFPLPHLAERFALDNLRFQARS